MAAPEQAAALKPAQKARARARQLNGGASAKAVATSSIAPPFPGLPALGRVAAGGLALLVLLAEAAGPAHSCSRQQFPPQPLMPWHA